MGQYLGDHEGDDLPGGIVQDDPFGDLGWYAAYRATTVLQTVGVEVFDSGFVGCQIDRRKNIEKKWMTQPAATAHGSGFRGKGNPSG